MGKDSPQWLQASEVIPMFPSLVWMSEIEPGLRDAMGADALSFHDPRRQASVIRPPVVELTAENTDQVVVRVRDGMLLLFPSYLEHSVDANESNDERISISFNLMFPSFAQRLSKPLW